MSAVVRRRGGRRYVALWLGWLLLLALATTMLLAVRRHVDNAHITLLFLLIVLGASAAGGRVLGIALAIVAFLSFNYFFLPPYYTLAIANPLDWLVLFAFLVTSIVAAQLLYRATSTAEAATARALEVDRIAALGAETLNVANADEALRAIAEVIRKTLRATRCEIFVNDASAGVVRVAHSSGLRLSSDGRSQEEPDASEDAPHVVLPGTDAGSLNEWIFEHGRSALEFGDGAVRLMPHASLTEAGIERQEQGDAFSVVGLHGVRGISIPLRVRGETVGVLRVAAEPEIALSSEQARFLDALAYYAALGVERRRLAREAERAEAERRVEALRGALLTAVSHDFRTPLTTIKAIAHQIAQGAPVERAHVIEEEADRLNTMIGDLLDLSRIQAGAVQPKIELNTVDELIGAALTRVHGLTAGRRLEVTLPDGELLAGYFDFTNSLRILVNLVENALKYSLPDAPVAIIPRREDALLRISVLDRGPGIPPAERERIFDPFYRPAGTAPDVRGTGLGLSIARGLAEAQGGHVDYAPRTGGGSTFSLVLRAANPEAAATGLATASPRR